MRTRYVVGLIIGCIASCYSQQLPIDTYYRIADSVASFPPVGEKLVVLHTPEAGGEEKIHALYILGEDPVMSDPDTHHVRKCLEAVDFLDREPGAVETAQHDAAALGAEVDRQEVEAPAH